MASFGLCKINYWTYDICNLALEFIQGMMAIWHVAIGARNSLRLMHLLTWSHCLGMSYYVNFLGGLGSNEFHVNSAPMAVKKFKILGAVLELPAKQQYQFGPFTKKLGKMG